MVSTPMKAAAAAVLVFALLAGGMLGWDAMSVQSGGPSTEAGDEPDPLAQYNLDYLGESPRGSLADSYLELISTPDGELP